MTINHRFTQRTFSLFVLLALVAGSVLPASAQRRRTRRAPRVRTVTRTVTRTVEPQTRYYTLNTDQTIRVRMDSELNSRSARIGDRFTTTVVDPVYVDGTEVIPAGSKVIGRVATCAARRAASPATFQSASLRLSCRIGRATRSTDR